MLFTLNILEKRKTICLEEVYVEVVEHSILLENLLVNRSMSRTESNKESEIYTYLFNPSLQTQNRQHQEKWPEDQLESTSHNEDRFESVIRRGSRPKRRIS